MLPDSIYRNARVLGVLAMLGGLASCSQEQAPDENRLSGAVSLDGSSTVFPISEAVAEEFLTEAPGVRVTVGVSGTGGGFKKFLAGEIDINDASRQISASEQAVAEANGLEYLEIPVAFDGLSVVVNPKNTWVDSLSVEELQKIWQPGSTVDSWNDVRAGWPDQPLRLYGPGTDSGTFDYFTEAVNGKAGISRPDYTASEDDNVLVQGIEGDESSLGFFGYAYYQANKDKLKLVPIDGGSEPVLPSHETIADNSYSPLSRPIFIYLSKNAAARPEVRAFVDFYVKHAGVLASEVGYIAMPEADYDAVKAAIAAFEAF
ncbi:MAG: PstS family phosphate ABC transporter substrate-binding protein [Pseudomonadales bacterium]|nr:PstS family phosphate ABC transporter substrate-binding protein [Pseudomonadales bacterium]